MGTFQHRSNGHCNSHSNMHFMPLVHQYPLPVADIPGWLNLTNGFKNLFLPYRNKTFWSRIMTEGRFPFCFAKSWVLAQLEWSAGHGVENVEPEENPEGTELIFDTETNAGQHQTAPFCTFTFSLPIFMGISQELKSTQVPKHWLGGHWNHWELWVLVISLYLPLFGSVPVMSHLLPFVDSCLSSLGC